MNRFHYDFCSLAIAGATEWPEADKEQSRDGSQDDEAQQGPLFPSAAGRLLLVWS